MISQKNDSLNDPIAALQKNLKGLPEQIEAVTSLSPLTVVSAGAGTGKTQTLSQRFAWLLAKDKDCRVDQILVLTFTEKAAREMQDRIKKTLVEWHSNSEKELPHLLKSIQRIDDAYISTIHSFAMKVIRESGLVLDIDPTASIVSKPQEVLWWKSFSEMLGTMSLKKIKMIVSDEWAERTEELFSEDCFKDFLNYYGPEKLSEAAKSASEKLGSFGMTPEDLWNQSTEELYSDIKDKEYVFAEIWDTWFKDIFPVIRNELREQHGKRFERLGEIELEYFEAEPNEKNYKGFARLLMEEGISNLGGCSKKILGSIKNILGTSLKEWRDTMKNELRMASVPSEKEEMLLLLLCRTCALGWQCWESMRKREGILTNNDLIRYAGEALERNPGYGEKFKHILVDEFQDTDGVQNEILKGLWNEKYNTLFIVGDIKQSIYRFRHANLEIFRKYIDSSRHSDDGRYKYITLDKSFRTRDDLVEKLNYVFGSVWAQGIEKNASFKYEPLGSPSSEDLWKKRNDHPMPSVFEIMLSLQEREQEEDGKLGKEEKIFDSRVRLYRELASRISEIHGSGVPIWDKSIDAEDKFRPVKWKDFALLVPKRSLYSSIEEAFDSVGIPYVLCTRRDYFKRGEIADLVNLVSLLAQPSNPSFLAGWIASPFSGIDPESADEILNKTQILGESGVPVSMAEILRNEYPETFDFLEVMRKKAELKGVSCIIRELLNSPGFLASYEEWQRLRVRANISYMAAIASEYEASEGRSLQGCADYMRFSVKVSEQQEEPEITDEDHDAVNVLTIHSAKGLEYPVVALGGVEGTLPNVSGIETSVRYGVLATKMPNFLAKDPLKDELTVSGLWHSEREKEAIQAENERFWYVASTRARDKLFICGISKTDKNDGEQIPPAEDSFLGMIMHSDLPNTEIQICRSSVQEVPPEIKAKVPSELMRAETMIFPKIISPAKLARLSASAYAMLSWCPAAYRIAYRQGRDMQWTRKTGEGTGGSEFGSLAHWILSKWDFDPDTLSSWVPQENEKNKYEDALKKIPWDLRGEFRSARSRNEIRKILENYSKTEEAHVLSDLAKDTAAGRLYRETPFRVQDLDLLLVGSTDIYWEDADHIYLRDWKTTTEETAPGEYYEEQLKFYAYSLYIYRKEKMLPRKNIEIGINYLREPSEINKRVTISDSLIELIGDNIHRSAVSALSDTFAASYKNCLKCPWADICSERHV